MDIGVCNLIHNPAHKADYRNNADCHKYQYELDVRLFLVMFPLGFGLLKCFCS